MGQLHAFVLAFLVHTVTFVFLLVHPNKQPITSDLQQLGVQVALMWYCGGWHKSNGLFIRPIYNSATVTFPCIWWFWSIFTYRMHFNLSQEYVPIDSACWRAKMNSAVLLEFSIQLSLLSIVFYECDPASNVNVESQWLWPATVHNQTCRYLIHARILLRQTISFYFPGTP